ncbi:hypothetical protein ElyMa_003100800 [Elysia marginata]|uniref:Uncharacterized protein n=1 Tax=Elysia marginata TaxID=1093978 RepID=A0AAV4IRF5_9GAST|nr:hypothetical protein ElyMa_003100800 [Elysia marginata]
MTGRSRAEVKRTSCTVHGESKWSEFGCESGIWGEHHKLKYAKVFYLGEERVIHSSLPSAAGEGAAASRFPPPSPRRLTERSAAHCSLHRYWRCSEFNLGHAWTPLPGVDRPRLAVTPITHPSLF